MKRPRANDDLSSRQEPRRFYRSFGFCLGLIALFSSTSATALDDFEEETNSTSAPDGLVILLPAGDRTAPMPIDLAVARFRDGRLVELGPTELVVDGGLIRLEERQSQDPFVRARYIPPSALPEDASAVTFEAREGEEIVTASLALDPGLAGRVEVRVDPPTLVKSPDAEASVEVLVVGADGRPDDLRRPRLTVNVGSLADMEKIGPGLWRARYRPGPARYPEVAVFAAFAAWPFDDSPALAFGHATLPLAAAIDLPGEVRPRVQVRVEIAGETFGPVASDRRGSFEVPVVVPPGHGIGRGHSIDRFGNHLETEIDLRLPPTNRMTGAVHPRRVVAGDSNRARLVILTVDSHGSPSSRSAPLVEAGLGSVGEITSLGEGVFVGWYAPPVGIDAGSKSDTITLSLPDDPRSSARLEIELVAGSPEHLAVSMNPAVVPAPSDSPARFELGVRDGLGSPVGGARISGRATRGELVAGSAAPSILVESDEAGTAMLDYRPPPDPSGWEDPVVLRVEPPLGDEPAYLVMSEEGVMVVVDSLGRPVPGARVEIGGSGIVAADDGGIGPPRREGLLEASFGEGARAGLFAARDESGHWTGVPGAALRVVSELAVPLMEPVPVDVEIDLVRDEGGSAMLVWRVSGGDGERRVSIQVGRSAPIEVRGGSGELALDNGLGEPVLVVDVQTGVSALFLAEAD